MQRYDSLSIGPGMTVVVAVIWVTAFLNIGIDSTAIAESLGKNYLDYGVGCDFTENHEYIN